MNTKTIRCILALTVCFVTVSAQAINIKAVPKPSKVSPKIALPHAGITIKPTSQSALTTVKDAAKNLADQFNGKAFDREMDQIAANIRQSIDRQYMTSQQLKEQSYTTFISGGKNGTVLSREVGFRDIFLPNIITLDSSSAPQPVGQFFRLPQASGLRSQHAYMDQLAQHFDGRASYDLLLHAMPPEKLQTDPYAGDLLKLTLHAYELVAKDQFTVKMNLKDDLPVTWDLLFAMDGATLKVLDKKDSKFQALSAIVKEEFSNLKEGMQQGIPPETAAYRSRDTLYDYIISMAHARYVKRTRKAQQGTTPVENAYTDERFKDDLLFPESWETEIPSFLDAMQAVSFTEYMVKENKFNFPVFKRNITSFNYLIVDLWHKLWNDKLSPEAGQFLLKDYMYANDALPVGDIMDQTYQVYLSTQLFPGFNFGIHPETLKQVCDNIRDEIIAPTSLERFNFQLGMIAVLLAKTLPESEFWKTLDRDTQIKVQNVRRLLDTIRQNTEKIMQDKPGANN